MKPASDRKYLPIEDSLDLDLEVVRLVQLLGVDLGLSVIERHFAWNCTKHSALLEYSPRISEPWISTAQSQRSHRTWQRRILRPWQTDLDPESRVLTFDGIESSGGKRGGKLARALNSNRRQKRCRLQAGQFKIPTSTSPGKFWILSLWSAINHESLSLSWDHNPQKNTQPASQTERERAELAAEFLRSKV